MKKLLIIAIMFISAFGLQAQKEDSRIPESNNKIMVGLATSFTSGTGISVRRVIEKHGATITVLPYVENNDGNTFTSLNLGLSYNYYFRQNEYVDFSIKLGTQYQSGDRVFGLFSNDEPKINLGIGPEINFHILPELDFEFYLGYGLYDIADSLNSSLTTGIGFYYNLYQ